MWAAFLPWENNFFAPIIRIPSPANKPAKYVWGYKGVSGVECWVITLDFYTNP
jgi:hypothetical protein